MLFSRSASEMYALADIFREELDVPIPDCPYSGHVPNRELLPPLRTPCKKDDDQEQRDLEYHADDEMSELIDHLAVDHGTNATDATCTGKRRGMTGQRPEVKGDVKSSSPTPDRQQHQASHCLLLKFMLDMIKTVPPTHTETRLGLQNWRCETAKAEAENLQNVACKVIYAAPLSPGLPEFSVFQILHDAPVEHIDKMDAVNKWQYTVIRNSFGSMPPSPPSLVSFLARRRSSLASIAQSQQNEPNANLATIDASAIQATEPPIDWNELPVILDAEESDSERIFCANPLPEPAEESMKQHEAAELIDEAVPSRAKQPGAENIAEIIPQRDQYAEVSIMAGPQQEDGTKKPEITPQTLRSMITVLTTPSFDVKQLKSFWEGQS